MTSEQYKELSVRFTTLKKSEQRRWLKTILLDKDFDYEYTCRNFAYFLRKSTLSQFEKRLIRHRSDRLLKPKHDEYCKRNNILSKRESIYALRHRT